MKNYEEKVRKAKALLEKLSNEELTLEESMKTYKEGLEILQEATKMIEEAKLEYEEISGENSSPSN